jgi:xylan 1,4-beta-xylosidase
VPFHGGFGLPNIHGIAKPSYRTYELLQHVGKELLQAGGSHATVNIWVIRGDYKCDYPAHQSWSATASD